MYKSIIIIIGIVWLISTMYLGMARLYNYPYQGAAMACSWAASILLLVYIVLFIKKHRK